MTIQESSLATIPAGTVVPIDPEGKYVFIFREHLSDFELQRLKQVVGDWWRDPDRHVLFLSGGGELRKLDETPEHRAHMAELERWQG